ncbi:MAG: HEPN domain-containing protein [Spirochaetes bacterium]|nr:HEPN domain-containing protein [Spirochaetota bacterium]
MVIGLELIKIANKDLKASKLLYEKGFYSQSIFFFQQSVEKAHKGIALMINQINEDELLKIGHQGINIFKKQTVSHKNKCELLNNNLHHFPEIKTSNVFKDFNIQKQIDDVDFFSSFLKDIKKNKNELINMSAWDLNIILKCIEYFNSEYDMSKKNLSKFHVTEDIWAEIKTNIMEYLNIFQKYKSVNEEEIMKNIEIMGPKEYEKMIKMVLGFVNKLSPIIIGFMYLDIVTSPHATHSRYPQNDLNPIKLYNKKMPLIKKLPLFFKIQEKILIELKSVNNEMKKLDTSIYE